MYMGVGAQDTSLAPSYVPGVACRVRGLAVKRAMQTAKFINPPKTSCSTAIAVGAIDDDIDHYSSSLKRAKPD